MPDVDEIKEGKKYYTDIPQEAKRFFLKGSNALDWGMQNRLSRIFNPQTGRTVMLAVDHGYFQGPTTGLERIDINILPLVQHADTLMLTRGILRSVGEKKGSPIKGFVKRKNTPSFKKIYFLIDS